MTTTRRTILATLGTIPCTLLAQQLPGTPPQGGPAKTAGPRAGIHPFMDEGNSVATEVLVDGKVVARLDHIVRYGGVKKHPTLVFALPPGLKRVQLRGTATLAGKAAPFDKTWTVRDMASHSAPLYDEKKAWIERIRGLAEHPDSQAFITPVKPKAGTPSAKAALQALEKRLGAPLPPVVHTMADWHISINEGDFLPPSAMTSVTETVLGAWHYRQDGQEKEFMEMLSPALRARYDRSLVIFSQDTSHRRALAWDPAGVAAGEPPGTSYDEGNPGARPASPNQGVWYWVHEDSMERPVLLLDDDYRPRTAESALTHVFQRFALRDASSPDTPSELVVDSANPRPNFLQLHFDGPGQPRLWMRSHDYHFSMY